MTVVLREGTLFCVCVCVSVPEAEVGTVGHNRGHNDTMDRGPWLLSGCMCQVWPPTIKQDKGLDWHQFVSLSLGKTGLEGSKGQLLGSWCTCMFLMDLPPDHPERGAGWGCWYYPVHAMSVSVWGNLCGCLFVITLHEKSCWYLPATLKVNFPVCQLPWVLWGRGTRAEANVWMIKAR